MTATANGGRHRAPDVDAIVDLLHRLTPERFVEQRDEVARHLREAGYAERAETVASLPRPTAAAWALNRMARARPDLLDDLEEAGREWLAARRASETAGDPSVLRTASHVRRELVERITGLASRLLDEYGDHDPGTRRAVAATLQAASIEPAVMDGLRRGRLSRERVLPAERVMLPPVAAGEPAPPAAGRPARREPRPSAPGPGRAAARVADRATELAAHSAREAARQAAQARAEVDRLARLLEAARRRADLAEARADAARRALEEEKRRRAETLHRSRRGERPGEGRRAAGDAGEAEGGSTDIVPG